MRKSIFPIAAVFLSAFIFSTTAAAQQGFYASITAQQEVPATSSTGTGGVAIILNAAENQITVFGAYRGTTSNVVAGHIHDAGPVGVNGPVRFNFNLTGPAAGGPIGNAGALTFAVTAAQVADLRGGRWYVNIHTVNFPGGEIRGQVKPSYTVSDFDGDGRTDVRTLRAANTTYYLLNSINNSVSAFNVGAASPLNSASDDYDGDGRGDLLTFVAEGTTRVWIIAQTATNTYRIVRWGSTAATDQVVPADYDGDGRTDIAIYRRTEGIWYIVRSSDGSTYAEPFGAGPNDIGIIGDIDKDGKNDLTVLRGTTEGVAWISRRSSTNTLQTILWGGAAAPAGDTVFPSAQMDIDGDGIYDQMVSRDSNGTTTTGGTITYYIRRSSDGQPFVLTWGIDTDTRLFGDYDGDGKTDIVARRTENGVFVWYIYQSLTGQARVVTFGGTGDARGEGMLEDGTDAIEIK